MAFLFKNLLSNTNCFAVACQVWYRSHHLLKMNLAAILLFLAAFTNMAVPWPISGVRMTASHWDPFRKRELYYARHPDHVVYQDSRHNPDENVGLGYREDLVEGDIKLMGPGDGARVMSAKSSIWPNKKIYFDGHLPKYQWDEIGEAMDRIEFWTCVRFLPKVPKRYDYVHITTDASEGCYAYVGHLNHKQPLNLGDGCWEYGVIVHELMHSLGFYHEHSRSDRDHRVTIHWENIEGRADDFKIKPDGNLLGLTYDTYSLMHYGEYAFSKHLVSKTITTTNEETIGHRDKISWGDVYKMNRLYDCDCDVYKCGP